MGSEVLVVFAKKLFIFGISDMIEVEHSCTHELLKGLTFIGET